MKCHLCLQERDIRNSHIIPEFLYRPGYDEKGRLLALEKGNIKPRYVQKGLHEKLLCDACENLLANRYEDYFAKLWYLNKTLPDTINADFLEVENLDYNLFKLFHLSILWRASISRLAPFKEVSIGIEQEERLREMLLAGNSGLPTEYQIFGALLLSLGTHRVLDGFIMSPIVQIHEGSPVYMFVFGGCAWHYVPGTRPIEGFMPISLSSEGRINLPVHDMQHVTPITLFFKEEVSKMKFPSKDNSR